MKAQYASSIFIFSIRLLLTKLTCDRSQVTWTLKTKYFPHPRFLHVGLVSRPCHKMWYMESWWWEIDTFVDHFQTISHPRPLSYPHVRCLIDNDKWIQAFFDYAQIIKEIPPGQYSSLDELSDYNKKRSEYVKCGCKLVQVVSFESSHFSNTLILSKILKPLWLLAIPPKLFLKNL